MRLGCVLRPAVGMVDAVLGRCAVPDGCLQRCHGDPRVHGAADGVADHLARPGVQDGGQVDKAARDGDVGQVHDPQLVGPVRDEILVEVRKDETLVVAVRRHYVASPSFGLQAMLAHQAPKLLAIDDDALVAECRSDPVVPVALELVADGADPDQKALLLQRNGGRVVESRPGEPHQLARPGDGEAAGPV